ncbi:MAG: 50S ribosomal protein L28 [SAR202 cluster bacterium]|nr:50S ribosomal protein L28 [SAR202 cluster bacterium]
MDMKCQLCGKIGVAGHNVSHSKRRTNTRFMPNIHKHTIEVNGDYKKVKICTRCLRSLHKPSKTKAAA